MEGRKTHEGPEERSNHPEEGGRADSWKGRQVLGQQEASGAEGHKNDGLTRDEDKEVEDKEVAGFDDKTAHLPDTRETYQRSPASPRRQARERTK
jgi:hypothetical protein